MVNDEKVSQRPDSLPQTESVEPGAKLRFRLEPHDQLLTVGAAGCTRLPVLGVAGGVPRVGGRVDHVV